MLEDNSVDSPEKQAHILIPDGLPDGMQRPSRRSVRPARPWTQQRQHSPDQISPRARHILAGSAEFRATRSGRGRARTGASGHGRYIEIGLQLALCTSVQVAKLRSDPFPS